MCIKTYSSRLLFVSPSLLVSVSSTSPLLFVYPYISEPVFRGVSHYGFTMFFNGCSKKTHICGQVEYGHVLPVEHWLLWLATSEQQDTAQSGMHLKKDSPGAQCQFCSGTRHSVLFILHAQPITDFVSFLATSNRLPFVASQRCCF